MDNDGSSRSYKVSDRSSSFVKGFVPESNLISLEIVESKGSRGSGLGLGLRSGGCSRQGVSLHSLRPLTTGIS